MSLKVRFALVAGFAIAGWGLTLSAPRVLAAPEIAGDSASGEVLFRKRACAMCHSMEPGKNLNGPSLAGVYGRAVGKVPGYRYSPGLSAEKGRWDKARLDKWLEDPRRMVPGSRMAVKVPSAQERAAIIAYLKANSVK